MKKRVWNTTKNPQRWVSILGKRIAPGQYIVVDDATAASIRALERTNTIYIGPSLPRWYKEQEMKAFRLQEEAKIKMPDGIVEKITAGGTVAVSQDHAEKIEKQLKDSGVRYEITHDSADDKAIEQKKLSVAQQEKQESDKEEKKKQEEKSKANNKKKKGGK